jgi:hypothetical protein
VCHWIIGDWVSASFLLVFEGAAGDLFLLPLLVQIGPDLAI